MAAPMPLPHKPPQPKKSSKIITLTVIGAVSVMVVGYCAATQNREDVKADCVDQNTQLSDGSYAVVDDDFCDSGSGYRGSHGAFLWYYGGTRLGARVLRGTTVRPSDVNISSRSGRDIQRSGFGGRSTGGS